MGNDPSQITIIVPHHDDHDPRIIQATHWYNAGAGLELGVRTLNQYLATIPPVGETLVHPRDDLPLLTLLERRIGNVVSCRIAGLLYAEYGYTNKTLVHINERYRLPEEPTWVRAHDGTLNLRRKPSMCLAECTGDRFAGIDSVGIAIFFIHGPRNHVMDFPASVRSDYRDRCAYINTNTSGDSKLGAGRKDETNPKCGAIVFALK
ncbi:MAG: hypothetical protein WCT28_00970 [Patescibacteria group bacterium]|jgi:hypothetical protein